MVYPQHRDERGFFQELYREVDGFPVRQISLCTINPGETRGRHYHKHTREIFLMIKGEMELTQTSVAEIEGEAWTDQTKMNNVENRIMINEPYMWHKVYSEEGCAFLILLDREFDPENPDTYTL